MPVPPAPSARTDQGGPMTATRTVPEGGLRFVPGVYRYSAGVAAEPGFALERVRFAEPVPLVRGFARDRRAAGGGRQAEGRLRRLRAALARALHRGGLRRLQPRLRRGAGGVGPVPRGRAEPGGPRQRLAGGRAPRPSPASTPSSSRCRTPRRRPPSPSPAAPRRRRAGPTTATTSSRPATPRPPGSAPRPAGCWARWNGGWPCSAPAGRAPPRCRPTRCTTSIPSSPGSWSRAAPPGTA